MGTITNDDTAPNLVINNDGSDEGDPVGFTLTLSEVSGADTTVEFTTNDDDATTADYTDQNAVVVTIPAGDLTKDVSVLTTEEAIYEFDEQFTATLANASGAVVTDSSGPARSSTTTFPPSVGAGPNITEVEGSSSTPSTATFALEVGITAERPFDAIVSTAEGDADDPADYAGLGSETVNVPAGAENVNVDVDVVADKIPEDDEVFTLTVDSVAEATTATLSSDATAAATITDDDRLGTYFPVGPSRILDTRRAIGGPTGKLGPGVTKVLDVTGVGGVPTTGVSAVTVNVTVDDPSLPSFLSVTPAGGQATSSLNFVGGDTVANLVQLPVGGDGNIRIFNKFGSTHVVADIVGYFTTGANGVPGSPYIPVTPKRILDSRRNIGGQSGPLAKGETIVVDPTGVAGVPATGVKAVIVNLTVVKPQTEGFFSLTPNGGKTTSSLNFKKGETRANLAAVPVSAGGNIRLANGTLGTAHAVMDIVGFYATPETLPGTRFFTLTPSRIFDTRNGGLANRFFTDETRTADVTGLGGVPGSGVAAVVVNVTVTKPTAPSYLSVTPNGGNSTSTLNFTANQVIPNLAVVPVGSGGGVRIYNNLGRTHAILDVVGFYR